MKTWKIASLVAAGVLVVGGGAFGVAALASNGQAPVVVPTPAATVQAEVVEIPTPTPTHTAGSDSVAVVVEEAPQEIAPPAPAGPVLCPEGTWANAVDEFGNESNCQSMNDDGQMCVGYDDAGNCTLWYRD